MRLARGEVLWKRGAMLKAAFFLKRKTQQMVYGEAQMRRIDELVQVVGSWESREAILESRGALDEVEVVLTSWGCPRFDEALLEVLPSLKWVLYGAGSIKHVVSEAFWQKGVTICSAYAANAVPVSEFTLGAILYSLKQVWYFQRAMRAARGIPKRRPCAGAYGSTVGLVSLGMIGRLVCQRLQPFDLQILAYDPLVKPGVAAEHGATLVGLEDLFARSDVVSLHTPLLPETTGMITAHHFRLMKSHATFINTSRGAVVREEEMIAVLRERPDLTAVLDVTFPEPPVKDSPLYDLDNVVLTPHIAGSMGPECLRLGQTMVEELERLVEGRPLQWSISRERARWMA